MINIADQVQDRWQKVEADRAPQKRKERPLFFANAGSKSRKHHSGESDEGQDHSHLDLTA